MPGAGRATLACAAEKSSSIGDLEQASAGTVFDARGLTILPGVIDTQVHFREPGLEYKEDLESGSRGAALGGVHRRVRNAEHQSEHHHGSGDQRQARAREKSHARPITPSTSAPRRRISISWGSLNACRACAGVKTFMGSSTGSLL